MTEPQRTQDPLAELLRGASRLDEPEAMQARAAFMERVDGELEAVRRPAAPWLVLAPMLAAAALALTVLLLWPREQLKYAVFGAEQQGNFIRASATQPATIRFDDATLLTAAPEARVRIASANARGAQVSLESGALEAKVTHRSDTDWRFVAGPFEVHVTGTRFTLHWEPETEQLEVALHEGSVDVTGYGSAGPVTLRAGQRLSCDAQRKTMHVSALEVTTDHAATASAATPGAEPTEQSEQASLSQKEAARDDSNAVDQQAARAVEKTPTATRHSGTSLNWTQLVAKAEFNAVVTSAEQMGVDSCLQRCSAADLTALADAARYTGRGKVAERALLSVRQRFSGTARARAAFLLGRLYEGQGQLQQAQLWYETYLREASGGAFASESLAGKMRAVNSLQGSVAARAIAREYLQRYPSGVHAATARQLANAD